MGMELSEETKKDILNTFSNFKDLFGNKSLLNYSVAPVFEFLNYLESNLAVNFGALSFYNNFISDFLGSIDDFVSYFSGDFESGDSKNGYYLACKVCYHSSLICQELLISGHSDNPVLYQNIYNFKENDFNVANYKLSFINRFDVFTYRLISHYIKVSKYREDVETDKRLNLIKENLNSVAVIENKVSGFFHDLGEIQKGQNFVKLSHSFLKLRNEKKRSAKFVKLGMYLTILLVPCLVVVAMFFNASFILDGILAHQYGWHVVSSVSIFMASLVFVSLYFYRVQHQEYKSIKAQESQLELRIALCSFIENYAKFKIDIGDSQEKNILEKFDNVIFSGLVLDETQVPTAYDGLAPLIDAISKIIPKKQ